VSASIRAGSRSKRFLCFVLIDVRCVRVPSGVHIPRLTNDHWSRSQQMIGVVGLERGPLSLVSTTEELLDRKVAAPV
jgi:hypothetical protein